MSVEVAALSKSWCLLQMAMDRDWPQQLRLFLGLAVRSSGGDEAGKCHCLKGTSPWRLTLWICCQNVELLLCCINKCLLGRGRVVFTCIPQLRCGTIHLYL